MWFSFLVNDLFLENLTEGTISTKTVSQYPLTTDGSSTTLHLPVSSESHDNVPDIVTRTTNNGQSTIWLPVMIGSVGLLLILLAFYILCRMRGRRLAVHNAYNASLDLN